MVTFQGNLIKQQEVYSYINLAELNPYQKDDRATFNAIRRMFKTPDVSLMNDIFQYEGTTTRNLHSRYFALTEQQNGFKKIYPSSVLAVAKTTSMGKDDVFIDMLQVNPRYIFTQKRKLKRTPETQKHCGTNAIEALQSFFKDKTLWLDAPKNLVYYFRRLGFEIAKFSEGNNDVLMKYTHQLKAGMLK